MLDHDLVLKHNELYLVGESDEESTGERATGLYARDTRFLDYWELRLDGEPLEPLDARLLGPDRAVIVGGNRALPASPATGREALRPLTVSVEQFVRLAADLQVRFVLANHSGRPLTLTVSLALGADFRDIFDIRGFPIARREGSYRTPAWDGDRLILSHRDREGTPTILFVDFSRPPSRTQATTAPEAAGYAAKTLLPGFDEALEATPLQPIPRERVDFDVALEAGASWELAVTLTPLPPQGPPLTTTEAEEARTPNGGAARISTGDANLDQVIARAASDLAMLHTSFPDGRLTAAGIPWFVAPFGRDSLIAGLQTVHLAPGRTIETLRTLAALQGTKLDPFREEEPGKILHEMRYGELARLGAIPHTPYYGSVDATPLFVMLFAEVIRWTADEALYRELWPNVERSLDWMETYGDRDGDGLIEYVTQPARGAHIIHQGWKDSHDSLHHLDGQPVFGGIALVEVQGYAYAAYRWLAGVTTLFGDTERARELEDRAERVRALVEERFWLPEEEFYAQALDDGKQPVAALSSNAGHLLYCELPSPERARAVAERLRRPDLDSGWGVRTLAAGMPSYNPMSYHNGSVWPHDNSLIAAGLGRYGEHDGLERIAAALFAAAEHLPLQRLPELYCGFSRNESAAADAPVPYPVSCQPQAWAAGAVPLLLRALLGLEPDPQRGVLRVAPALPEWLPRVRIADMQAFGKRFTLDVAREGGRYRIHSDGPIEAAPEMTLG